MVTMYIYGGIILFLEALIGAYWIYHIASPNKSITPVKRVVLVILILLINTANYIGIYLFKAIEAAGETALALDFPTFFYFLGEAILSSAAGLGFQPNISFISDVIGAIPFFVVPFVVGLLMGAMVTISIFVAIFGKNLINRHNYNKLCRKYKKIDYLVGAGDLERNYYRNHSSCVLLLPNDYPSEERVNLIEEGFIVLDILDEEKEAIFNIAKKKPDCIHNIVVFDDSGQDQFVGFYTKFLDAKKPLEYQNLYLYLEVEYEKIEYFRMRIDDIKDSDIEMFFKTHITLFNRYEIMSGELCFNEPTTKYFPLDFVNKDTSIDPEKEINIFIIGFGKMNKEMYKKLIINNQFVQHGEKYFESHLVNYYIFDEVEKSQFCYYYDGVNDLYKQLKEEKENYYDLPEKISNSIFKTVNVNSSEFLNEIKKLSSKENSVNFFFISFGDDYYNVELAKKISSKISCKNYHMWARIDDEEFRDPSIANMSYFGRIKEYLVHDKIVDYEAYRISADVHNFYGKKQFASNEEARKSMMSKDYIAIFSNYYQIMNIRHKLNLLGFDLVKNSDNVNPEDIVKEEDFKKAMGADTITKYNDYKKQTVLTAIIAEEHLHWNAQYILGGFKPMKKSEYVVEEYEDKETKEMKKKVNSKDIKHYLHGCITSYNGLDLKTVDEIQILKDNGVKEPGDEMAHEVFQYDYYYLANCYKYLNGVNYVMVKRK